MRIRVKLIGALRNKLPNSQGSTDVEMELGATVEGVLQKLDLPAGRVHLVMVNGEMEHDRARTLSDGDEVMLFPPVAGG